MRKFWRRQFNKKAKQNSFLTTGWPAAKYFRWLILISKLKKDLAKEFLNKICFYNLLEKNMNLVLNEFIHIL